MANETGKRYSCSQCGSQFVVTKGGNGTLTCCGEPVIKKA
ncbi:MAG: desulfoferrodoxin [Chloroflexota bacterium]|nr:desulfoferrodoxin [Chloroflexota bacterium]